MRAQPFEQVKPDEVPVYWDGSPVGGPVASVLRVEVVDDYLIFYLHDDIPLFSVHFPTLNRRYYQLRKGVHP